MFQTHNETKTAMSLFCKYMLKVLSSKATRRTSKIQSFNVLDEPTDPNALEAKLAKIKETTIMSYFAFYFVLYIYTDRDYFIRATTGGDPDKIKWYSPSTADWDDHVAAGIFFLEYLP